jgi:N-acetylneuraminate synthase
MKIIAEIGCNHKGSMTIAKAMIEKAANYCGVDIIKFQKRNNKELLTLEEYNAPHPNSENSYGDTYGLHRESLEFTIDEHLELKKYCEEFGVDYSCSVWDLTSAKEIISINPKFIKIPSAKNNNYELLDYIYSNYTGEVHISLGMSTIKDIDQIYSFIFEKQATSRTIFYHCISDYPVKPDNICLRELEKIKGKYKNLKGIGFSGHHEGNKIDNIAIVYDCLYLERHFTLNKNWKGTDHQASLEPEEMRELVTSIKLSKKAWKYKDKEILDCELLQKNKLKRIINE